MSIAMALAAPSTSVTLGGRLPKIAEELESLLPGLREVTRKLEEVEERFCRPLLLTEPEESKRRFAETLLVFAFHIESAILPLFSNLLLRTENRDFKLHLKRLMDLEKRLFKELKPFLEEKAISYGLDSDAVIKIHAAMIDYDLWLISSLLEVGFDGFLKRLLERAKMEAEVFTCYLYSLFYVMMCIDLVLLREAPHRKDTFEALVSWGSIYAEEVEDYLDTLSLLISDEAYEALTGFVKG
ncbi:MAG: hypothetical protein J7K82_03035 [Thermoproteales archaeon]|nr:hypothetical protein [Thermoproteales archaeon]